MDQAQWTKNHPAIDGFYWMRRNGQTAIFQVALGKIWGMLSAEEQHPPKDAEWLGPITPDATASPAPALTVEQALNELSKMLGRKWFELIIGNNFRGEPYYRVKVYGKQTEPFSPPDSTLAGCVAQVKAWHEEKA